MLPLGKVCEQPLPSLTRICENGKLHPTLPKFPNLTGNKKDTQE